MPKCHGTENQGCDEQGIGPGGSDLPHPDFQQPGHYDQNALSEHGCKAVESAPYPHEEGLPALGEGQHIETVSRNVVGGTCEGCYPEDYEYQGVSLVRNGQSKQDEAG